MDKSFEIKTSEKITIREAELEDVDLLFSLTRTKGVKEALPGIMKVWFEADIKARIKARIQGNERHHVLVAEHDGKIVGYTRFLHRLHPVDGIYQTTAHETAVHPDFCRKGIGRRLTNARLESALNYADGRQDRILFKAPVDIDGNHFHRAIGFEVVGKEPSKKRDVFIYALNLNKIREQRGMALCKD